MAQPLRWGPQNEDAEESEEGAVTSTGNRILFYRGVGTDSVQELVTALREADTECLTTAIKMGMGGPPPIHLHINSPGGDLYAAFAAIDHIRGCRAPVYTYVEGAVASAATLMSTAGSKRFMRPNAYMLIHQLSADFSGRYEILEDEQKNVRNLMSHMKSLYRNSSKIPEDKLDQILQREIYLDAKTCLEWGLVDSILAPRN